MAGPSAADLIKSFMRKAGVLADPKVAASQDAHLRVPVRVVWNGQEFNAGSVNPIATSTAIIAIFRGVGEYRIYTLCIGDPERGDPPACMYLTQTSPTMLVETMKPDLFEASLIAEYKALAAAAAGILNADDEEEGESVECVSCSAEMPTTFSHCGECGAELPAADVACSKCLEKMPAEFEFCSDCGTKMPDPAPSPAQGATGSSMGISP